jgi:nucleotide-binding universal stress UspA family protein
VKVARRAAITKTIQLQTPPKNGQHFAMQAERRGVSEGLLEMPKQPIRGSTMKTKLSLKKALQPVPLRRVEEADATMESGNVIEVAPVVLHLKKILVPYDFSGFSTKALNYALKFAEQFDAAVLAVHVLQPIPILPTDVLAVPPIPDITGDQLPAIDARLRKLCRRAATTHHLTVTPLVVVGNPYEKIVETAEAENIDLIIIATHGYTGFKHFCMGSTAERVVRHAPCPVLVVRDKERDFVGSKSRRPTKT